MTNLAVISGAVVIAALGLWALIQLAKSQGRAAAERDAAKQGLDDATEYRADEVNNSSADTDDLRKRLQRWSE